MRFKYRVFIILVVLWWNCSTSEKTYYTIQQGDFQATITETGELQAVRSRIIVMPRFGWKYGRRPKIASLIEEGTSVSAGDIIGQIDSSGIVKFLKEQENEFEIFEADLRNMQMRHENERRKLEGQLASAKANHDLAKIQLERTKFESAKRRRISLLNFEKDKISLSKVHNLQETTRIKQENDLKIQKLKFVKLRNEIETAKVALTKTTLKAPINGLVEYRINWRTDQKVRAGDELWPGAPIVGIPDLSQMKVKTAVSEVDIYKIIMGQKVVARLDAFPHKLFPGHIVEIARLCHSKEDARLIKLFQVYVLLEESAPILKPGMTVGCEIFTAELEDVLYVANECLVKKDSKYYLYFKDGAGQNGREVKIGPRNNKFTVIYGNYEPGLRVVNLQEPGAL